MIIFIGCGKYKNNVPCNAENMYLGSYFKTCLNYAKFIKQSNDTIYILSAKYGILSLDTVIEPYNKTLNTFTKAEYDNWLVMVTNQLHTMKMDRMEPVTFLCGKNYYKGLCTYFNNISTPLEVYPGMGYQIQFMLNRMKIKNQHKLF